MTLLYGQQTPADALSQASLLQFAISQMLSQIETVTLVRVVAVAAGGVGPVGSVDVTPLVSQVDGIGQVVPHGVIHALPYFRLQGGANAVVIDPAVGDIGIAGFASRDLSAVKASKAAAPPGSQRRFDFADGLYFGGCLNGTPTQIVQFGAGGINVTSPVAVTVTAPTIALVGNVAVTGTLTDNGHDVGSTHRHSGVSTGVNNTGTPL